MVELQLIGGGKMGGALVAGVLASGWVSAESVRVVETSAERRAELLAEFPGIDVASSPGPATGTVLAVKPAGITAAAEAAVAAGGGRLLSIAAGVSLAQIEQAVGDGVVVIRAMPNTPALVGAGAAAIAAGSSASADDLAWAAGLLGAVGTVVTVAEAALDAVTGVSGSGPAYVFLFAEALIEAGVLTGLTREVATTLAVQTLVGSAAMLAESGDDAATLRAAVTSPGGTTAAALRVLEQRGVRAAVLDAVAAAAARSAELAS